MVPIDSYSHDLFAAAALQGILSNHELFVTLVGMAAKTGSGRARLVAEAAWDFADAMIQTQPSVTQHHEPENSETSTKIGDRPDDGLSTIEKMVGFPPLDFTS